MRTWIGLFRGINVGGHNKVPMKDLVTLLCGLGLQANPFPAAQARPQSRNWRTVTQLLAMARSAQ